MTKIDESSSILNKLNPRRIIIPILIGLGVTVYLIYTDLNQQSISWEMIAHPNVFWLAAAWIVLVLRDVVYIYRIRYLTDKALTWRGSFYTIILWEFSSAISPSAVGGTAIASFLLLKEGISFGKSLAYVLVSAILDNMFFILFGGGVLLANYLGWFPQGDIFHMGVESQPRIASKLPYFFYVGYTIVTSYTLVMMYGLFAKPHFIKGLLFKISSIRWFKRWRRMAVKQGEELVIASGELKGKGFTYWNRAIVSTVLIWVFRYFIVNCLISAYSGVTLSGHIAILSLHVILWVILLIGFTPGAAGFAEVAFEGLFTTFVGGIAGIIAVFWRMVTYYPYLILGAIFLPRWVKRVFASKAQEKISKQETEEVP